MIRLDRGRTGPAGLVEAQATVAAVQTFSALDPEPCA
jgi:hypothetical protein